MIDLINNTVVSTEEGATTRASKKKNIQYSLDALLRKQEIEHERGAQGVPNAV